MKNQTEIEDIEKLKKKVEAHKAMKIFITPADNGFNVAIDAENSKNMSSEEYELVSGEGDTDNDKFQLIGKQLFLENSVDFEEQDELSIRVKSTDCLLYTSPSPRD